MTLIPLPKDGDLTDPKYVKLMTDLAYGNVKLENPKITREMVEAANIDAEFDQLPKAAEFGF